MSKCLHDEHFEIGVDHFRIETFERQPNGETRWDEGDEAHYGTFTFRCHVCHFARIYHIGTKYPKWLIERITSLGIRGLLP